MDIKEMELDVLEMAHDCGLLHPDNSKFNTRCDVIKERHDCNDSSILNIIDSLVLNRYLLGLGEHNSYALGRARGITPKGYDRLQELKYPTKVWVKKNWFGVFVLGITTVVNITAIVVNALV